MDLGWDPYQTELDELVEKEIAAVISRNKERKRKKGKEGTNSNPAASASELNERLFQVEDFMERWDEKLEVWGTMISKLYEVQFKKSRPWTPTEIGKAGESSRRVPSPVSGRSEDSTNEKDSNKSDSADLSDEGNTSHEQDEESADQSPPVLKNARKQKEVVVEKGWVNVVDRGEDNLSSGKESEVCNCVFKVKIIWS